MAYSLQKNKKKYIIYNFKHRISNFKRDRFFVVHYGIHVRLLRYIYDDVA